ncbi:MAG TPA: FkbM family methyltransferase [Anaerolineaceae bacterium]|nr:FkbM family methyltransferase [Anaerolineaceae bacterium]
MKKYSYYLLSIVELLTGVKNWPLVVRTFLNLDKSARKKIHLRRSGLTFLVRGKMDIWSVKEAFIDRFYEKFGSPIGEGWSVVDIGAGIGEFTLFAAAGHPRNRVYAFEPFAESFELLKENIAQNRIENVQAYPEAVWGASGNLLLDLSGGEPLQLQSVEGAREQVKEGNRLVICSSLCDVLERLGIAQIDLLKLDCEGAEYPILLQTGERALAALGKVQRIVMEYHDGISAYSHADLEKFLREYGFRVRSVVNQVHPNLGYLYAER